jgi:hypothetical protein
VVVFGQLAVEDARIMLGHITPQERLKGVNMPEDNKPGNLSTEPSLLWRIFSGGSWAREARVTRGSKASA